MNAPAILELGNGQVLLRGAAVVDAARLVTAALNSASRDGIVMAPRVRALADALAREASVSMSAHGHADVREDVVVASSAAMDTTEVAAVLGVSERQARRRAAALGARRVAGRWVYDRTEVHAAVLESRSA